MAKLENGVYKNNGYTNEAFQLENYHEESKGNHFQDPEKPEENFHIQEKTPDTTADVERAEWGGRLEFLMACIATSVGLGNVWRFPFTAYENGGGAFLVPYIIVLIFVGKPFYFLEGLLGQFTSKSCAKTWSMAPAMKGLGYGQAFAAFCVVSYYCALMALTLYYLAASFQSVLPWAYCREEWQGQCFDGMAKNNETVGNFNQSVFDNSGLRSSAELYFRRIVLKEYDTIDNGIGVPSWQLTICLFLSWASIFAVLFRGVKSTGKAAYFLAIFPYVIMIALLIRAVTLEGAVDGILFFVTPQWDKLWLPQVWYAAITQCFFSLSVCFGPIITYSSYNNFGHRVDRDVMIVTTLDTFTSLMAGCTIFGILGNLAHEMGTKDISKVVRGGTGLAFISYPDALSRFTVVPQLFAVLFFIMMFVLGTGSAVALCGAIFGILCDYMPKVNHWKLVLMVSVFGFAVSLVYITPGGQWFITLVDYYGGTCVAIIIGVFELITIFWIYGLRNFINDMEFMLGNRPSFYWRFCWSFVTPVLMIVILIYTIVTYQPPTYDGMQFPVYAYAIGWLLLCLGIAKIVGFLAWKLIEKRSASLVENHGMDDQGTPGVYKLSVISRDENEAENKTSTETEDKNERAQWGNGLEFLMSCVAFSVGLGNVWRFPYTAYENGGGAFLIPYVIVLFVIGKPFYYMEMILGQFTSRSCVEIWSISPAFKGIGYGVTVSVFSVVTYYCALMSLTLYYMLASMQSVLPWAFCWEEWGDGCFDSMSAGNESSNVIKSSNVNKSSSADFYFRKVVLSETGIHEGLGDPSWKLVLCLLSSWIFVFVVLYKGVKSSGKAAYFLALFPYVIMISLLVRAVTLDGAVDGIIFLFKPSWHKILDPGVWYAAVTQSFFSLGVCFGAVTMYSSYNSFDHNVSRDCTIVTSMDLLTSLMAGTTIFGILGNLAHELGSDDISTVVRAGTGLAFISYPEALAKFTVVPQLFAVLFFLMLFVLGIGTTVAFTGVIISVIRDKFPTLKEWKVAAAVSCSGFLIGIVYCTPGGQYILNLVDYFGGTFIIVFLASFEVIAVSWIYGVDNFLDDVEFMVGNRPSFYWRFCWGFLTPLTLFTILIYFLSELSPIQYNGEYYPTSAYAAGWILLALGVTQFPVWIIVERIQSKGKSCLDILKPNLDWGPKDPKRYKEWRDFKESKLMARSNPSLGKKRSRIVTMLIGKD